MRNQLTKDTLLALSVSFQEAVTLGIYERHQIVREYEPSKILEAFQQALHWQIALQNASGAEIEEGRQNERKLARRIFVSYFKAYLSCI